MGVSRSGLGQKTSDYTSYNLNSFKEGYIGDCIGAATGVLEGATRILDHSSYAQSPFSRNTLNHDP